MGLYFAPTERGSQGEIVAINVSPLRGEEQRGPDSVYEEVQKLFSEKEIADLTLAATAINSWNRLNNALRTVPGAYQPARSRAA